MTRQNDTAYGINRLESKTARADPYSEDFSRL